MYNEEILPLAGISIPGLTGYVPVVGDLVNTTASCLVGGEPRLVQLHRVYFVVHNTDPLIAVLAEVATKTGLGSQRAVLLKLEKGDRLGGVFVVSAIGRALEEVGFVQIILDCIGALDTIADG